MNTELILAAAITLANLALVAVTFLYAKSTRDMVREMRTARSAQVLPKIVPAIHHLPGGGGFPRIVNAGSGPALNVELQLALEPDGPVRRWTASLMVPREEHSFFPDPEKPGGPVDLDHLVDRYRFFSVTGTCRDALGDSHHISELLDVRDYWTTRKAAMHLWRDDWRDELPRRLKQIVEHLKSIAQAGRSPRQ